MKLLLRILLIMVVMAPLYLVEAEAQRRGGGGGGFRGGGGGRGGGGFSSRGGARTSVSRPRPASRPSGGFDRPSGRQSIDRPATRPSTGRDRNVNRDINRDRDVNVNRDWNNNGIGWNDGCCHVHHPVAAAAAVTGAAYAGAAAANAYGSYIYSLPAGCVTTVVNGISYQNCGGTYYEPQFYGTDTAYVVVADPD